MAFIAVGVVIGIMLGSGITVVIMQEIRRRDYRKMEHILDHYMEKEMVSDEGCLETRESKIISKLYRTLRMVDDKRLEAEKEKEGVTRFLSDMSHQLKTPLANIRVYTELLKDESLTKSEIQEFVRRIDSQSEKMQWLMKTLFQASRLETGAIQFKAEACEVMDTIQAAVDFVQGQAAEKKIQVVSAECKPCDVIHNPKWTTEALTNILENAIKYSPEGSRVTVSFEPLSLYGRIDIKDEGIGIAKEEYADIYKRFYRSSEVSKMPGSGLGLYLSQLIVSLEGGYITVDSVKEKGSTFSVYLQLSAL